MTSRSSGGQRHTARRDCSGCTSSTARARGSTTSLAATSRRHPRPPRRRWDPGGDRQPDDLRQGDRGLGRTTTSSSRWLTSAGCSVEEAYWELVVTDVIAACAVLRPVYRASARDGRLRVRRGRTRAGPRHRRDDRCRAAAARAHRPAQPAGEDPRDRRRACPPSRPWSAEGRNINVTLLFSLGRYAEVIEAYLSGWRPSSRTVEIRRAVHSVASFFVSRVDTEVDATAARPRRRRRARAERARRRSPRPSSPTSCSTSGSPASGGSAWPATERNRQLPLWASTSAKDPADRDTRYVEELIGPRNRQHPARAHDRRVRGPRDGGPHASTPAWRKPRDVMRRLCRRRHRHGRRRPDPGEPGSRERSNGRSRRCSHVLDAKRQRLGRSVRWTGPDGHCSGCSPPPP